MTTVPRFLRSCAFSRTVVSLYAVVLTYLLLAPDPLWLFGVWGDDVERAVDRTLTDYLQHGLCYSIFTLLLFWSARSTGALTSSRLTCCAAVAILHGLLTEFLQMFIPQRHFAILDIAANVTGVLVIGLAAIAINGPAGVAAQPPEKIRHCAPIPPPRRSHLLLFALFVSGLIFYGSIVPLQFVALDFEEGISRFIGVLTEHGGLPGRVDFSTNVLLFVVSSFFWLAAFLADRRGFVNVFVFTPLVLLICTALSLSCEMTQVWIPGRVSSRFDVLAHFVGTLIGTVLWFFVGKKTVSWLRLYSAGTRRSHRIDWLLQLYLVGLIIYNLLPFDLIIHPAELFNKFERGRIQFALFRNHNLSPEGLWELLFDVLIYIPVGVLSSSVLSRSKRPVRPLLDSLVIGGLIVVGVEFSQLFVYSRFTETTDVITGLIGIFIGAWFLQRWRAPKLDSASGACSGKSLVPALKWFSLTVVYLVFLCVFFWWPLEPISDHELIKSRFDGFLVVPLRGIYRGSTLEAWTQLIRKPLLFVPLGILLVKFLSSLELKPWAHRLLLLVAFTFLTVCAVGIELVQSVFPPHGPDLTDTILYFLGGLVGMCVWMKVELPDIRRRSISHRSANTTLCRSSADR